jgi:flagellin
LLKLDRALRELATDRAGLGAFINRLQSTLSNLSNTVENSSLARSRILDTDFAAESSALAKGQIIEQAGISVLGQANQSAKQVISLLQNG